MDGRIAGYVSSGAYGFTLGASVGMGYVRHPDEVAGALADSASWEIEIACERDPAEASLRAFLRPRGRARARLRGGRTATAQESAGTTMQSSGRNISSMCLPARSRG